MSADLLQSHAKIKLLVKLFIPVVFLLISCSQREPTVTASHSFRIDGMDPVLARKWMDNGSLPNFRKLATMGEFQRPTNQQPATVTRCLVGFRYRYRSG